jgi:hypothetical protein
VRFRSRPSEVEAVQWRGDNVDEVRRFGAQVHVGVDGLALLAGAQGAQGWVTVPVGHWLVRAVGVLHDHWPVADEFFQAKYEPVAGA